MHHNSGVRPRSHYRSHWGPTPYLLAFCLSFISAYSHAQQTSDEFSPESGQSISVAKTDGIGPQLATEFIVSAANPIASKAAFEVLKNGGNAIDAMVTLQTVLSLVEPQSSGLGGGSFLLYYDAKAQKLTSFDARETAPLNAPLDLFMEDKDTPMTFFDAVVGGRAVGTPGTVKLLWDLHHRLGTQEWPNLLLPAIKLAQNGFIVSPRMANAVANDKHLKRDPVAADYFFPKGQALEAGHRLKNPEFVRTLNALAEHGGDYFYNSFISQSIINTVQKHTNKGYLSQADFSDYNVIEREAVCAPYRQYEVCGMGPPSSGAITVSQTLGILSNFDLAMYAPLKAPAWNLIAEASRLAFADRGLYIADPDFVSMPKGLLSKAYLAERATLIQANKAAKEVKSGQPSADVATRFQQGRSPEQDSTSHFVIVDRDGNIVSMTSSIENGFGSRLMSNGFLLNNQLTDFSFSAADKNGQLIANRVEAGKRPRSSMAPTIVFENKQPYIALGSPGGSRIISYVTNALVAVIDWNLSLQQAFDFPHITNRFGMMSLEADTPASALEPEFQAMGYKTSIRNLNSGLQGVVFTPKGMIGAADKRREGLVLGR